MGVVYNGMYCGIGPGGGAGAGRLALASMVP